MDRNGSLRCAAQSFPISSRRSESATPRSRRVRSRRSRTAFVTASAMLSPVSLASWCASLCASLFLMLRLIKEPFYHHSLPCYLYKRQGEGSPFIYGPILSWLLLDRGESAGQSGGFSSQRVTPST